MGKDYTLTLYVIPSPYGLDWSSPRSITRTTLRNHLTFKGRNIGHVIVELSSPSETRLTGMRGVSMQSGKLLFLRRMGLGILFHYFRGRLETMDELRPELQQRAKEGRLSFIRFLISETTHARLRQYLHEYESRGHAAHYGLSNRPRHGEGAGCSAFAMSFIDLAGLIADSFSTATQLNLLVPQAALRPPVSIHSLLWSPFSKRWARENEKHRAIRFWDPDQMHRYITQQLQLSLYPTIELYSTLGLLLDARSCPCPSDPVWISERTSF